MRSIASEFMEFEKEEKMRKAYDEIAAGLNEAIAMVNGELIVYVDEEDARKAALLLNTALREPSVRYRVRQRQDDRKWVVYRDKA
jgi:hypothetical protein